MLEGCVRSERAIIGRRTGLMCGAEPVAEVHSMIMLTSYWTFGRLACKQKMRLEGFVNCLLKVLEVEELSGDFGGRIF